METAQDDDQRDYEAEIVLTVYTKMVIRARDRDDALIKLNDMDYGPGRYLQHVGAIEEA